jgi:transposase
MGFVAPYLTLVREDAPEHLHNLREVFNALRWIVRAGTPWRMLPNDFPPWEAVYQQTQHWLAAGCFEAIVHDLRARLRLVSGKTPGPTAAIMDIRTLRSTPESSHRSSYDGAKRKKGSKLHAAVGTLGHLLALRVTPATEQDRAQVERLAEAVQEVSGQSVEVAYRYPFVIHSVIFTLRHREPAYGQGRLGYLCAHTTCCGRSAAHIPTLARLAPVLTHKNQQSCIRVSEKTNFVGNLVKRGNSRLPLLLCEPLLTAKIRFYSQKQEVCS